MRCALDHLPKERSGEDMIKKAEGPDFSEQPPATDPEPGRGQELLHDLQQEWDKLNRELAQLRQERDQLATALAVSTWKGCSLTKEEILAQVGKEKPLREFLNDLRQHVGK
jgi:hypothetical protein